MSGKSKNDKYSPDEPASSACNDEVDTQSSLTRVRMHIPYVHADTTYIPA